MPDADKLLSLPWQIQLALGSGYCAYALAYRGIRDQHKPIDTIFRSIAFGLVASALLYLLPRLYPNLLLRLQPAATGAIAFIFTLVIGGAWRVIGRDLAGTLLRRTNVSWADDSPSAWARMQANSRFGVSQIAALLDDGTWVHSNSTWQFRDAPFGPCILGLNGDLALYVTHSDDADGTHHEAPATRDAEWGDQLTYIPAARIRQVVVRYQNPAPHWPRGLIGFLKAVARKAAVSWGPSAASMSQGMNLDEKSGMAEQQMALGSSADNQAP